MAIYILNLLTVDKLCENKLPGKVSISLFGMSTQDQPITYFYL